VLCENFPSAHAADPPPNVLWICGDDHAAYVCGAYGNQAVRTPNLDRLAGEGMRFDRAYCNSPVCTASRQSFLTGRYPQTIGVTLLQTPLPESEVTLAEILKAAGYDTAAFGKMHFNSNLKHGFDRRLDVPDHRRFLERNGRSPIARGIETLGPWRPFKDHARVWLNSACLPYAAVDQDMADTWFARNAAEFLQEKHERPFFLMVSFSAPHSPFHFPVEFRGRHKPDAFTVPQIQPQDREQIPAIFRDLSPREKQGIIASYYTSTEFLDKNVGMVLDALGKSGHAKNTLVIYTGDHGYMLGQHGRLEKHCFYEPAVRAPLIMRFPERIRAAQNTAALVEFVDIAPTVLELCGLLRPEAMQGRSLLPILTAAGQRHREPVFSIYCENEEAMVRDERFKLIYCTGNRVRQDGYATEPPLKGRRIQLFDLQNDPDELKNLSVQPEHSALVKQRIAELARHLRQTVRQPELIPAGCDDFAVIDHCLQPRDVTP
jgi:choline-sulfatase